mgnify:CR=1 FL=1
MALGKPATAFSGDLTRNNHVVDRPRFVDNSVRMTLYPLMKESIN